MSASLREWQSQITSLLKNRGRMVIRIGGHSILHDIEMSRAFCVRPVDCQKEIIRMLYPARKKPQK